MRYALCLALFAMPIVDCHALSVAIDSYIPFHSVLFTLTFIFISFLRSAPFRLFSDLRLSVQVHVWRVLCSAGSPLTSPLSMATPGLRLATT